jgi:alpha-beta hydrolase superfamily lysophospholipase
MSVSHEEGFFTGRDGLRLYYQRWAGAAPPRAILALVHGYLEHGGRYRFVVDHFAPRGFTVYVFDHRGHGRSEGRRGYIDSFDQYLQDLDRYLVTIQEREGDGSKLFLVGHSLGGLVSLRYAIDNPEGLAGVVASSPYLRNKVPVSAAKLFVARVLSRLSPAMAMEANLDSAALSHDPEVVRAHEKDPLVLRKFTVRWTTETLRAQEIALSRAPDLQIPCLLLQAGDDQIADPQASRAFFERMTALDKEWRLYEGYHHEVFNEVGRERVFRDLEEWLGKRL